MTWSSIHIIAEDANRHFVFKLQKNPQGISNHAQKNANAWQKFAPIRKTREQSATTCVKMPKT